MEEMVGGFDVLMVGQAKTGSLSSQKGAPGKTKARFGTGALDTSVRRECVEQSVKGMKCCW